MIKTLNTYTDKEREEYLEEYRNSNLAIGTFTRAKNIPTITSSGLCNKNVTKM